MKLNIKNLMSQIQTLLHNLNYECTQFLSAILSVSIINTIWLKVNSEAENVYLCSVNKQSHMNTTTHGRLDIDK